jgi:hypothetical protein
VRDRLGGEPGHSSALHVPLTRVKLRWERHGIVDPFFVLTYQDALSVL